MSSINEKLDYLNDTKQLIRSSLVQRGQTVDDSTPFRDYASKILNIDTQSDFIDNRTVINDFTYQNDGYYKDMPNSDDYKVNTTVLCIGNLYSAENVLEQTAFVIYQIMSVSDGNAHCKVVDILDEYNVGDIKLFETVEEMNADDTAKDGDLAIVYKSEIQNMTATTQTQYITFPETVTLPEAFTGSSSIRLRAVDESVMFDGNIRLNQTSFRFDGYSESGMIRVHYTSSDGVTYTRDEFMGDRGDLSNPVDLGTTVHCAMSEKWNDNFGYFMLIGGMNFGGLYKYGNYPLEGIYCNSYNTNTELNNIPYLSPSISRPNEVEHDYNIIIVTDSHLDTSGLYKVIDKCKVLWYGGYGKDAVYNGKQGILVTLYEPSYAESSSTNMNLVLEEYDFTVSTNATSKQIIRNWGDISIFPSPVYVAQQRSSANDSYNSRWYFTSYENVDYTGNGHPSTYKHTIYTVPNDITLPISHTGYSKPGEIISKVGADYYVNVYTNRYEIAPTQYTLTSSNQLLPNISAYGKNGNVTGDGSIYDNTLTPTEYKTALNTSEQILGEEETVNE